MKRNEIEHIGVITAIPDSKTVIVTIKKDACTGCSLGKWCTTVETDEDTLTVRLDKDENFSVGERVKVIAEENSEIKAIMLCFVIPSILFICGLFIGAFYFNSIIGCVIGFAALAIYFFSFYINKNLINQKIKFFIVKDCDNE